MKQRATIYLDQELWRLFRSACIQRGYSASTVIEQLIHEQLFSWQTGDISTIAAPDSSTDPQKPKVDPALGRAKP